MQNEHLSKVIDPHGTHKSSRISIRAKLWVVISYVTCYDMIPFCFILIGQGLHLTYGPIILRNVYIYFVEKECIEGATIHFSKTN